MEFGKLHDISQVDFRLPDLPELSLAYLDSMQGMYQTKILIGCTGWGMKEWVETWYPPKTKPKDFLSAYSKQFNTVELNSTFYSIPSVDQVIKWKEQTPDQFRFVAKMPSIISRNALSVELIKVLNQFIEHLKYFDEKLETIFIQFPPNPSWDLCESIQQIKTVFPVHWKLAVEFRSEDFQDPGILALCADQCLKQNVSWVITDVAGRREFTHQYFLNSVIVVRWVGNNLDPTDYSRMDDWCNLLKTMIPKGAIETIYFFIHQPDNVKAPELVQYMSTQLDSIPGVKIPMSHPSQSRTNPQNLLFS